MEDKYQHRSAIKFLVTGKWKPWEIYKIICDVYREACFSQKSVYKRDKHELVSMNLNKNSK